MSQESFEPTQEQQDIICHDDSAFVTACPGAGKTWVVIERARRLFQNMPSGRGVAFLSFAQASVLKLEPRLRQVGILPTPIFPSFSGTFDSFVWQFVVAPFGIKGCGARPRIIAELGDIPVKPFKGAHSLPLSCFCPLTGVIYEQDAKLQGFNVSQKSTRQIQAYSKAAKRIRSGLREKGYLDFDDARNVALERLKESRFADRIAAALASRFCEIIVDEAQDCNPEDLKIISWLRNSGLPVKVVCDPNQSIYGFRGGVTDHLFDFADTFNNHERKSLTNNFRSTPNICKVIVQLRPPCNRGIPDESLGPLKHETAPVHILSYLGNSVPASIGTTFRSLLDQSAIDVSFSPVIAATRASCAAAVGQPSPITRQDRSVRLAKAVTDFHFAAELSNMKNAIDHVHQILLELQGRLDTSSYNQYLAENQIEPASWRSKVVYILRELRFDPVKFEDAKAWHIAAKNLLAKYVTIEDGQSISQKLKWNDAIKTTLTTVSGATPIPRTIHSVKGMEYPAVCVVTTIPKLKQILDFLETGKPVDHAEDARKLYVAASRAQKLLVIAAPKSQTERLCTHLCDQGATVTIKEI